MRNSLLEEAFQDVVSPKLIEQLGTKVRSFSQLVAVFGLDPRLDFRHSDLAGVDFSGSNLCGFDFTGADLRGSFGIGVSTEGVILGNADLTGSLFEYRVRRAAYFDRNPSASRLLQSLSAEHWTSATLWVAEQVGKRKREDAVEVAKALFLDTKDAVLRNQILFFLARAFNDRAAYLAFLLETLASHGQNIAIHRSVIRLVGQLFYNQRAVFEIMLRELRDERVSDQREILVALARSVFSRTEFRSVWSIVRDRVSPLDRRFFVSAFVSFRGVEFAALLDDPSLLQRLDHEASISDRLIRSAARTSVDKHAHRESHGGLDEYDRAVDVRAVRIRDLLRELSDLGLELTIEEATARERRQRRDRPDDTFRVPEGRRVLEG